MPACIAKQVTRTDQESRNSCPRAAAGMCHGPHDSRASSHAARRLAFYRDTLGPEVRNDVGKGKMRWITVGPSDGQDHPSSWRRRPPTPASPTTKRRTIVEMMAKGTLAGSSWPPRTSTPPSSGCRLATPRSSGRPNSNAAFATLRLPRPATANPASSGCAGLRQSQPCVQTRESRSAGTDHIHGIIGARLERQRRASTPPKPAAKVLQGRAPATCESPTDDLEGDVATYVVDLLPTLARRDPFQIERTERLHHSFRESARVGGGMVGVPPSVRNGHSLPTSRNVKSVLPKFIRK